MKIKGIIHEPFYDHNDKKYIKVTIPNYNKNDIEAIQNNVRHKLLNNKLDVPLFGNVFRVKVPFRYRRVTCKNEGDVPIQSMQKGDHVEMDVVFSGTWNIGEYSGFSWKLNSIKFIEDTRIGS